MEFPPFLAFHLNSDRPRESARKCMSEPGSNSGSAHRVSLKR